MRSYHTMLAFGAGLVSGAFLLFLAALLSAAARPIPNGVRS